MLLKLLLLFVLVPVVELALLIKIGRAIDVGPTIALVILTGVIGAALARHQGLRTLARIQENLSRGIMPTAELVDGLMILVAGAFLMTPGILTDGFGFALLIPPARAFVRRLVIRYFRTRMVVFPHSPKRDQGPEGEFIDVDARGSPGASPEGATDQRR